MTNILTAAEGAIVLRTAATDTNLLALLPQIDGYIKAATGHDWAADSPIRDEAKAAARMLLVKWYEDPGAIGSGEDALSFGLRSMLLTLEVIAQRYKEFLGSDGAGAITLVGAHAGDSVVSVTGLRGVSGDQSASFETVISVDGQIQQVSTDDLSENVYRAYLVPMEEL